MTDAADAAREPQENTMKIDLQPFTTPNYVIGKLPPRPRQEGFHEGPKWKLCEVDADVLAQLCDDFRAEVFQKAGKPDPAVTVKS